MDAEWHRAQIAEASETVRFLVGLVVAVWSIIFTADAALLVFGATKPSQPALFIAATFPLIALGAWMGVTRSLLACAYVAFRSEMRLGSEPGIAQSFTASVLPRRLATLRAVAAIPDPDQATSALRELLRPLPPLGRSVPAVLVALTVVQLLAAWVLTP